MSVFDDFRAAADKVVTPFLAPHGFRREASLEEEHPTWASVVYIGNNVAFDLSYDVRDQVVDTDVVRVENGALKDHSQGGYSQRLFTYLVKHTGYRGTLHTPIPPGTPPLERMLHDLVDMLKSPNAQTLLADRPDSLP